jgi:Sodium:dicarboxylate symporter family
LLQTGANTAANRTFGHASGFMGSHSSAQPSRFLFHRAAPVEEYFFRRPRYRLVCWPVPSFSQQLTILLVAMLTSKGASGITGAGFITLAATLAVVDPRLVPGMAIVLGIDRFMSECRALTNLCGNGVACVVVSWWEGELDKDRLHANLNKQIDPSDVETAITTG